MSEPPSLPQSCQPVDLAILGEEIAVRVPVRPSKGARLVWINHHWLASQGCGVDDDTARQALASELLARFAVVVEEDSSKSGGSLWADRYGGSRGSPHGGSGRCAGIGGLNAKGIGRTPLASTAPLLNHADGRLPLHEALLEAVSAEIAALELPFGAVRTVAIIMLDDLADGDAIIVRSNPVRPAHFERSIFFGDAGHPSSAQATDARRVESAVKAALSGRVSGFKTVPHMLASIARQNGAAMALRLWQGRLLTSNLSIDGALLDFGSFRAVPSWRAHFGEADEVFGVDLAALEQAFWSLDQSFTRYGDGLHLSQPIEDMRAMIAAESDGGFVDGLISGIGIAANDQSASLITDACRDYRDSLQGERVCTGDRWTWQLPWAAELMGLSDAPRGRPHTRPELRFLTSIDAALANSADARTCFWTALARFLWPRKALYLEVSKVMLGRLAAKMRRSPEMAASLAEQGIASLVSDTIRTRGPYACDIVIEGQAWDRGSTVLYGKDRHGNIWAAMSGPMGPDGMRLFGTPVAAGPGWVQARVPSQSVRTGCVTQVLGSKVTLPRATRIWPIAAGPTDLSKPHRPETRTTETTTWATM